MAVFGSILRADCDSKNMIDIIVNFDDDDNWSLFYQIRMQQELQVILQSNMDLVTKHAVEKRYNWIRRQEILNTAFVILMSLNPS